MGDAARRRLAPLLSAPGAAARGWFYRGYSLGARIVARALTLGARPRRAFIGGTGLDPIGHAAGRGENYGRTLSNLAVWEPGTPEAEFEGYVRQVGAEPGALIRVLDTFVDTTKEDLAQVPQRRAAELVPRQATLPHGGATPSPAFRLPAPPCLAARSGTLLGACYRSSSCEGVDCRARWSNWTHLRPPATMNMLLCSTRQAHAGPQGSRCEHG
jgi:hypothetical protein